ncbi:histidine kinase [Actimicrobium sp. CCI2.3]|uniref:PAS domain-containing sensor histidine kinase n=1 Tax=Actimicrobium sp. CCI2.3 TaxID=3048616 RepID=UPI002AB4359A|nr:histidine kinase [Actimicrobium sp. CCI2.3]MDY7574838.1 histidine kinase [Actimicrobium sp. CCI2.3]MEB0020201.1 histidine kinase [Actimicrobium sp. CCI2.3]
MPSVLNAEAADLVRLLVAGLDEQALITLDASGLIVSWNRGAELLTGYCNNEILGRHVSCLYPPRHIAGGAPESDLKQARCREKFCHEGWRMRKNGAPVRVSITLRRLVNVRHEVLGYGLILRDAAEDGSAIPAAVAGTTSMLVQAVTMLQTEVTERRRIEHELLQLQSLLRELAAHQDQIKEDERKRIAREIHDELGQNLLALRLDVSMLMARCASRHPHLGQKAVAALGQIDAIMSSVRAIINNLRPGVLDFGLQAAIEWQVREFQRRSLVVCELHVDHTEFELDDHRATALFRILQESLTNINRHSQASRVSIALKRSGNKLSLSITDNGIGVRPGCRRKANSFGLVGIAERIHYLNGELTIDSTRGRGTTLRMTIPILPEEE